MCDGGVMVSIVAFQAVDPGSIPGHRIIFFHCVFFCRIRELNSSALDKDISSIHVPAAVSTVASSSTNCPTNLAFSNSTVLQGWLLIVLLRSAFGPEVCRMARPVQEVAKLHQYHGRDLFVRMNQVRGYRDSFL
jgi:hypothetical protein